MSMACELLVYNGNAAITAILEALLSSESETGMGSCDSASFRFGARSLLVAASPLDLPLASGGFEGAIR